MNRSETKTRPQTNYLRKIPEFASIHPSLQKAYEKRVPWTGRKILESNMLSDANKIRLIRMADPESAELLEKGVRNIDKGSHLMNKYENIIKSTPKSLAAYELYKSNYGGKRSKRIKTKRKRSKQNRNTRKKL